MRSCRARRWPARASTNAELAVYLDSSALVKLVVREAESDALIGHLRARPVRVSCGLARTEVVRAVGDQGDRAVSRARRLLERIALVRLDDLLLDEAAALDGPGLRTLDAIHLAAAQTLGDDLLELITYDRGMAAAAGQTGVPVLAPA